MNAESKRRARSARPEVRAELHFLEQVRIRLPGDVEVARALADLYTRVGRFEDGRTLDLDIPGADVSYPSFFIPSPHASISMGRGGSGRVRPPSRPALTVLRTSQREAFSF